MPQQTIINPQNDPTITAEKFAEKLPSSKDPADKNFVSSDVDNCIKNFKRSEKKNAKKNIATMSANYRMINRRKLYC